MQDELVADDAVFTGLEQRRAGDAHRMQRAVDRALPELEEPREHRELGLDVVAEGAETDSDAVELYHLGCQYAQGAAFGEPMTAEEAERLLGITADNSAISSARRVVMGALRS